MIEWFRYFFFPFFLPFFFPFFFFFAIFNPPCTKQILTRIQFLCLITEMKECSCALFLALCFVGFNGLIGLER